MKNQTTSIQVIDGTEQYNVDVIKNKSIRVRTSRHKWSRVTQETKLQDFDTTFNIGDSAEYDSYNLSYVGTIKSITHKTVTIIERDGTTHRLNLRQFCWRNYDFNLDETLKSNQEISYTI